LLSRFEQIVAGIENLKGWEGEEKKTQPCTKVTSERHPLISLSTPSAFLRAI